MIVIQILCPSFDNKNLTTLFSFFVLIIATADNQYSYINIFKCVGHFNITENRERSVKHTVQLSLVRFLKAKPGHMACIFIRLILYIHLLARLNIPNKIYQKYWQHSISDNTKVLSGIIVTMIHNNLSCTRYITQQKCFMYVYVATGRQLGGLFESLVKTWYTFVNVRF